MPKRIVPPKRSKKKGAARVMSFEYFDGYEVIEVRASLLWRTVKALAVWVVERVTG